MTTDTLNDAFQEPNATPAQPELLVSAVLHLMSQYTVKSKDAGVCLKLASVIERHLKALAALPDLAPVLRATCQQLSEHWASMIEHATPQQQKSSLFARLVAGSRSRPAFCL